MQYIESEVEQLIRNGNSIPLAVWSLIHMHLIMRKK